MGLQGGVYNMTIEGQDLTVGGDIILSILGLKVESEEDMLTIGEKLKSLKENDQMSVKVMRGGKIIDLNYTIPKL